MWTDKVTQRPQRFHWQLTATTHCPLKGEAGTNHIRQAFVSVTPFRVGVLSFVSANRIDTERRPVLDQTNDNVEAAQNGHGPAIYVLEIGSASLVESGEDCECSMFQTKTHGWRFYVAEARGGKRVQLNKAVVVA